MDKLYLAIEEQLTAKVTELRWIDYDFGQLEVDTPPVSWPCALIHLPAINYINQSRYKQMGETTVSIRLGFKVFARSHSKTNDLYKDQAFDHIAIINSIVAVLHGFESEHFSALVRTGMNRTQRIKHREYVITFKTVIYDTVAMKTLTPHTPPEMEADYE